MNHEEWGNFDSLNPFVLVFSCIVRFKSWSLLFWGQVCCVLVPFFGEHYSDDIGWLGGSKLFGLVLLLYCGLCGWRIGLRPGILCVIE